MWRGSRPSATAPADLTPGFHIKGFCFGFSTSQFFFDRGKRFSGEKDQYNIDRISALPLVSERYTEIKFNSM